MTVWSGAQAAAATAALQAGRAVAEKQRVPLTDLAARVMSLAQDGDAHEAARLARLALARSGPAPDPDEGRSCLWYALAVAEHVLGDADAQLAAADRCLALAGAGGSPGWASNALSMRAMARVRQGAIEPALADLASAEVELARCDDEALRCWAHTGLGYCYDQLRLYELARPHFEAAVALDASPMPLPEAPVIDLLNLAELHLRWADELERVVPVAATPAQVADQRARGRRWAQRAHQVARRLGVATYERSCVRLDLCARADVEPADVVPALRSALAQLERSPVGTRAGERAQVATALARALRALGDLDGAVCVARLAAAAAGGPVDWQVTAAARHLVVELEAERGVPAALDGREYGRLLSHVLWKQRLQTLQGARSALEMERMRRAAEVATRVAREDPLTGLGNRRALDEAVLRLRAGGATARGEHSLVLIDLDHFKTVNDTHGHLVGDDVLRAVAGVLRSRARTDDVLVRLGGDEFVVLAPGVDATAATDLTARLADALDAVDWPALAPGLRVKASVGVATTTAATGLDDLVGLADAAMYAVKRGHREAG